MFAGMVHDMQHGFHELWHEMLPVLGGAVALAITGWLFHRKRNGKK